MYGERWRKNAGFKNVNNSKNLLGEENGNNNNICTFCFTIPN